MNDPNIRAPRLLERYREEMLVRRYAKRTITSYVSWVRRYLRFHHLRHPREMGQDEINAFLTHLAVSENLSASSQNQALGALLFLYRTVLGGDVGSLEGVVRGHRPQRLPVVLTEDEVRRALSNLQGTPALVAQILYGSGLRLMEALCLRIKDMDFEKTPLWFGMAKRCVQQCKQQASTSPQSVTHSAILLQPTYWSGATISVRSRSCLVIAM